MKLLFDDRALGDLEGIFDWIAQDSPKSAKSVIDRIFASTELLASFPYMGRAGATRERANGSCRGSLLAVYEVHEIAAKCVIAVFHIAHDWEARLKERRDPTG